MKDLGRIFEYAPAEWVTIGGVTVKKIWIDMLPVYCAFPQDYREGEPAKLCLFLSGLSGNKESLVELFAQKITSRGYVGVFFDHFGHGERSRAGVTCLNASKEEAGKVGRRIGMTCFTNMYRYGWEIIGNGVLDAQRVMDYFQARMPVAEFVMGGVSMGGDTSIAAAGADTRLNRVLCLITTPDWLRPGMCDLFTGEIMDPGKPDAKSQWYYDQFNPMTHLSRYARGVDALFACGEKDTHIPPENAQRFIENLSRIAPDAAARMQIWWNRGAGHVLPQAADMERLFDWFLLKKPMTDA